MREQWEERFERRYGFWRGFVDEQVRRNLDCGLYENGFARVRCPECHAEYLLWFSCKIRELCPSCAARRAAAGAVLLAEEVLEEVGHAQWVFVIPKMLRPYFLHHREFLGGLARAAWETVLGLVCAAVDDEELRPGMVTVVQTAVDLGNWHPHVQAMVSRGGWTRGWEWAPVPFADERSAEHLIERARFLATQARDPAPHYQHSEIGYNYRLSNILAAIGRGQLRVLEDRVAARRANFEHYQRGLGDLPGLEFMPETPWGRCTRWLTCLTIDPGAFGATREDVRLALEEEDIESRPVWKPMHLQPVFEGCRVHGGEVAEGLFERGLCLPSGSSLTAEDRERVIGFVRACGRT